jgi:hypothetical protein
MRDVSFRLFMNMCPIGWCLWFYGSEYGMSFARRMIW